MRHATIERIDTLVTYDNAIDIDARCDYQDITWSVAGETLSKSRQLHLENNSKEETYVTVHIRAEQHGAIFEDDIIVNFTKRPRPKFPDVRD